MTNNDYSVVNNWLAGKFANRAAVMEIAEDLPTIETENCPSCSSEDVISWTSMNSDVTKNKCSQCENVWET